VKNCKDKGKLDVKGKRGKRKTPGGGRGGLWLYKGGVKKSGKDFRMIPTKKLLFLGFR